MIVFGTTNAIYLYGAFLQVSIHSFTFIHWWQRLNSLCIIINLLSTCIQIRGRFRSYLGFFWVRIVDSGNHYRLRKRLNDLFLGQYGYYIILYNLHPKQPLCVWLLCDYHDCHAQITSFWCAARSINKEISVNEWMSQWMNDSINQYIVLLFFLCS